MKQTPPSQFEAGSDAYQRLPAPYQTASWAFAILTAFALLSATVGGANASTIASLSIYSSGFETSSGYAPGNLDAQDGWVVNSGSANVWTTTVYGGTQAAQIKSGGSVTHQFGTSSSNVTITTYMQAVSSPAPSISATANAALLYLDANTGITCLNGDGNGNGTWVGSGIIPSAGTWFRLDITLDYSHKTWSCLVNGASAGSGLNFQSTNITGLGSLTVNAPGSGQTLLDAASVAGTYTGPYPFLNIAHQGSQVLLSWPAAFSGFTVQQSPALRNPTWTTLQSINNQAVDNSGISPHFYRLIGNY